MIYFKFPFNNTLFTVEKNGLTKENLVVFHSFDNQKSIEFNGKIAEVDESNIALNLENTRQFSDDRTGYIPETKQEYLQSLSHVISIIKEKKLPKLVLSRRKIIDYDGVIDLNESFNNLCKTYPNAFKYVFKKDEVSWIGAFSEVLGKYNKKTSEFETMSLAGTLPVEEAWSTKEIEEQKPVSTYIRNILTQYNTAEKLYESETYDHISGNIKHLKTDFKAKINAEDLETVIQALHPTPAVCGIPKDFCFNEIQKVEKFPRELYAGYIKIETEDMVYYFVNLRCARLYRNKVHLFVGGGITAESNIEKEWQETELKSEAILQNLSFA
ncbi:chorismate-binding protein [Chryseobacterium sp.]|uniref:chorismate-binding protein n=1 Tax=Chryseobacterium sp. TaxID=1871047 RepID=UPI00388E411F